MFFKQNISLVIVEYKLLISNRNSYGYLFKTIIQLLPFIIDDKTRLFLGKESAASYFYTYHIRQIKII